MASTILSTVTATVIAKAAAAATAAASRANKQGGILESANPSEYDSKNPIIIFIIQVHFFKQSAGGYTNTRDRQAL